VRFELTTCGLQNRCTTPVLLWRRTGDFTRFSPTDKHPHSAPGARASLPAPIRRTVTMREPFPSFTHTTTQESFKTRNPNVLSHDPAQSVIHPRTASGRRHPAARPEQAQQRKPAPPTRPTTQPSTPTPQSIGQPPGPPASCRLPAAQRASASAAPVSPTPTNTPAFDQPPPARTPAPPAGECDPSRPAPLHALHHTTPPALNSSLRRIRP
jgi:hypothetical protein